MSSAYLLVSHGSRDPRPQIAMSRLAQLVRQRLAERKALTQPKQGSTALINKVPEPLVSTASLELATEPLHEQIRQFAKQAQAAGWQRLQVLPLFLLPGMHVSEDIPAEVALAQQAVGEEVAITLLPHLGNHPGMNHLLAQQFRRLSADAQILLSHGSSRAQGNQPIEALAAQLGVSPAYWSVSPSLTQQVETLVAAGCPRIAICPYFLFPGGITEAIASLVEQLQSSFEGVQLLLGEPLGATTELANLIVEQVER